MSGSEAGKGVGWADGCSGKRDLSADPGRALDLLLAS